MFAQFCPCILISRSSAVSSSLYSHVHPMFSLLSPSPSMSSRLCPHLRVLSSDSRVTVKPLGCMDLRIAHPPALGGYWSLLSVLSSFSEGVVVLRWNSESHEKLLWLSGEFLGGRPLIFSLKGSHEPWRACKELPVHSPWQNRAVGKGGRHRQGREGWHGWHLLSSRHGGGH